VHCCSVTLNDSYGHNCGDQALREVAQRLSDASRRGDMVARLGGDEFVVLAEDITPQATEELADRLRRAVAAPIAVDDASIRVTLSVGIAFTHEHPEVAGLVGAADANMYRDKRRRPRGQEKVAVGD